MYWTAERASPPENRPTFGASRMSSRRISGNKYAKRNSFFTSERSGTLRRRESTARRNGTGGRRGDSGSHGAQRCRQVDRAENNFWVRSACTRKCIVARTKNTPEAVRNGRSRD